jgi:hypothetical protein
MFRNSGNWPALLLVVRPTRGTEDDVDHRSTCFKVESTQDLHGASEQQLLKYIAGFAATRLLRNRKGQRPHRQRQQHE